jgi:hypothetical protein
MIYVKKKKKKNTVGGGVMLPQGRTTILSGTGTKVGTTFFQVVYTRGLINV